MYKRQAEEWGLSRAEVDVLLFLQNNPGCNTAREVVELRGMAKSGVSKAVDALVRRGYLAAAPDGRDRRVVRLEPVSYTHLDVYKRQGRCRWASWPAASAATPPPPPPW